MESKPLQLPDEWKSGIEKDAAKYRLLEERIAFKEGATGRAQWLYTCQESYKELKAKCDRYEELLNRLQNLERMQGRDGCTWGDTEYDSLSACAGYNQALEDIEGKVSKALADRKKEGANGECTCSAQFKAAHGRCYKCPENQKEDKK